MTSKGDTYIINGQAVSVGNNPYSLNSKLYQSIYSEKKQNLAEAAQEIKNLLKQFEQNYPTATEAEQLAYLDDETTPSFKRRVAGLLQASGEAAIDEFILENKYLKVAKAAIKGWFQPGS